MRKLLYGIPTAALAMVIATKVVKAEVKVGDGLMTQVLCKTQEATATLIRSVEETGGYEVANQKFAEFLQAGECIQFPAPVPVTAVEVGYTSKVLVDSDGDTVRMTAVLVQANPEIWVTVFEVLGRGGKS